MLVTLVVGQTYNVTDHYGIGFGGIYRGMLEEENATVPGQDRLLLFEKADRKAPGYRYAGVTPEVSIGRAGLSINLVAHHYGNTPSTVKHCCSTAYRAPKWRKAK